MRFKTSCLIVALLLICSACAVQVSPVASPTGTIDPDNNTITEVRDGVAFTVGLDETSVVRYRDISNITAFYIEIDNRSAEQVSYPPQQFLLKDAEGHQYRAVPPERVREIVSSDMVYLIPYPYVGFYYLNDQVGAAYRNSMSSNLPYYAEYRPQDIFTRALTREPILPQAKVEGVIYFQIDLEEAGQVELSVYKDKTLGGEPLSRFFFKVGK
jgi:(2Fe-2S) ferredoxin